MTVSILGQSTGADVSANEEKLHWPGAPPCASSYRPHQSETYNSAWERLKSKTMDPVSSADISHVIQLSVAPVFLLAGIGAFINAFAGRLGRIFDRSRILEADFADQQAEKQEEIQLELETLWRRARLAYFGIALDIIAALLVCLLIAIAFAGHFFSFEIRGLIGSLFIGAMLSLIGGLIAFLREVFIAVRCLSIGMRPKRGAADGAAASR